MSMKRQVAALLAQEMSPAEVSRELGVDESYLSQLKKDSEFVRILSELRAASSIRQHGTATKIDTHYDNIELKLAETVDEHAETIIAGMAQNPTQLTSFMRTINGMKRRGLGEGAQQASTERLVEMRLPAFLVEAAPPVVQHNSRNEVIQVDDRPLVSLSGTAIKSQLRELEAEQEALPPPQEQDTPAHDYDFSNL